jgi:NADPH:quinone reductase-like Zn-dependent oxidoreductase/thioesterase domain-containing protein/acyl carrier protein
MAEAAAAIVGGADLTTVETLVIHEPLIVPAGERRTVQTIVSDHDGDARTVEIYSRARVDADDEADWRLHAVGRLTPRPPATGASLPGEATPPAGQRIEGAAYYAKLETAGVSYGPAFRGLQRAERGEGWASGTLVAPDVAGAQRGAYRVHPGVLDACFQTIGLAMPGGDAPDRGDHVYLPIEVGAYRRCSAVGTHLRVEARVDLDGGSGETVCGTVQAFDETGALVLDVSGLRFKRASRAALARAGAASIDGWLHEIEWRRVPPLRREPGRGGRWLLFVDGGGTAGALAAELTKDGATCTYVSAGEAYEWTTSDAVRIRPGAPEDFVRLLDDVAKTGQPAGVVHCWNLDVPDGSEPRPDLARARLLGTVSVLHLVQAVAGHGHEKLPLTVVTRQAQPAGTAAARGVAPLQAAVWGLGRVVLSEHPELQTRLVDLDAGVQPATLDALTSEVVGGDWSEPQVALRGGERLAPRLVRSRPVAEPPALRVPEGPAFGLEIAQRGVLENLVLRPVPRTAPGPREVAIRVEASGLNFRDVLNALGMYPGDPGHLGGEVVGVVDEIGSEVTKFAVGDPVLALTPRGFCSHVTTAEALVCRRPDWLSVDAAATIPIVFQTSQYALVHVAKMRAGERVLIHAGAGGVGLAAIQIAQLTGAEIFATAGSPQKRDLLRSLGVPHVMDSRTLAFAGEIREITRGDGIDIVLNSLAGDFIPTSLTLLRTGGRFLELGKTDLWDDPRAKAVNPNASYSAVYLGDACVNNPALIEQMYGELMPLFERRALRPLPFRSWPIDRAIEAFRYMAQAKHTGKVVIEQRVAADRPLVRPDGAYVVTGAFSGLGLAVAGWLADRGARHLLLVGRREPGDAARSAIAALEAGGASVVTAVADVADRDAMDRALQAVEARGVPVRGVVHSAGALDDGVLLQQRADRFASVMRVKVDGGWHLHRLTAGNDLDFFVLFSAGAGLFGAPGQANYAAANAYLDALAWSRRAAGQPAVSIDWGPWSEVGMAARLDARERERWAAQGLSGIDTARGLVALERAIGCGRAQVAVLPIAWDRFVMQWPPSKEPSLLRDLSREHQGRRTAAETAAPTAAMRDAIAAAPAHERRRLLNDYVRQQVARILGMPASELRDDRGFAELGMDSLMSVELSNALSAVVGRRVPTALLFEAPTIPQLADALAGSDDAGEETRGWRSLVPIHPKGSRPPLFAVPGVGGDVVGYAQLAQLLGPDQPFYGLQARGLDGSLPPFARIEEAAEHHLKELRETQAAGPYHLMGLCMGGVIAFEMAQQLVKAGQQVEMLAMFDSFPAPPLQQQAANRRFKPVVGFGRLIRNRIVLYRDEMRGMSIRERFQFILRKLKVARRIVETGELAEGRNEFFTSVVERANGRALIDYKPQPYGGRLLYFFATERKVPPHLDQRSIWRTLVAGDIEQHELPTIDSGAMLREPHVFAVAKQIENYLRRLRGA